MITARGNQTPIAVIFKHESHKLHIQGVAKGLITTATFSAALVTGNSIAGTVNGTALSATAFATSSDSTLAALAAKIALLEGIKSATVVPVSGNSSDDRVIEIVGEGITPVTGSFTVTGGASQATVTVAQSDNRIYKGMPVKLETTGYIVPLGASAHDPNCIGYAIHDKDYLEDVTVAARGYSQVWGIASGDVTPGPVKYDGWDAINKRPKYSSAAVTDVNFSGWAMEASLDTELVKVVVR